MVAKDSEGFGEAVIVVKYKKQRFRYDAKNFTSFEQLQLQLLQDTKIPIANQKLIVAGKIVDASQPFDVLCKSEVTLLGSTQEEVEKLLEQHELHKNYRVRDDFHENNANTEDVLLTTRKRSLPEFRFESIRVLEAYSDKDKAREILETLAEDPGFLAVLAKHRWKVGTLSEMKPEGFVGVSEVCVLGVNMNKGQEISLRIRTDDFKGFRKMASIREVLCHELAHMVHSEHDDKFYVLMRQIQREVEELNWTLQTGRTLMDGDTVRSVRRAGNEYDEKADWRIKNIQTRKLREQAALKRINEQTLPDSVKEEHLKSIKETESSGLLNVDTRGDDELQKGLESLQDTDMHVEESEGVNDKEFETSVSQVVDHVQIHETGPFSHVDFQALPPISDEIKGKVKEAIESVCARNDQPVALDALLTISKLLRNVLKYPEELKYRRVNMANRVFHDKVLKPLSGRLLMIVTGWSIDEATNSMVAFNDPDSLSLMFYSMTEVENYIAFLQGIA